MDEPAGKHSFASDRSMSRTAPVLSVLDAMAATKPFWHVGAESHVPRPPFPAATAARQLYATEGTTRVPDPPFEGRNPAKMVVPRMSAQRDEHLDITVAAESVPATCWPAPVMTHATTVWMPCVHLQSQHVLVVPGACAATLVATASRIRAHSSTPGWSRMSSRTERVGSDAQLYR